MSATEGTLLKILRAAEKIEENQREQLKLDRERAGHCSPRSLAFDEGAITVNADPRETARRVIYDLFDRAAAPALLNHPVPLFPRQEQTELGQSMSKLAADLVRQQLEFEASLPTPPAGFAWVRHDKWPSFDAYVNPADGYVVQTEYHLEPLPGFPFSREEGAR